MRTIQDKIAGLVVITQRHFPAVTLTEVETDHIRSVPLDLYPQFIRIVHLADIRQESCPHLELLRTIAPVVCLYVDRTLSAGTHPEPMAEVRLPTGAASLPVAVAVHIAAPLSAPMDTLDWC